MREFLAVVTVLALLASARAGPISSLWDNNDSQCAKQCVASQKFQYAPDTTYIFDYQADTATNVEDASEDTARLSIAATAYVHVISACDMVLQLRDVSVKESDPNSQSMRSVPDSAQAASLLERTPLRFSFQDGVVEELCPSNEELWALNVKRGVLSVFQNSMSRLDSDQTVTEVDVAGRCPAQYQVENKGWYSTTVKRSKDLLACTGRHDYQSAVSATPYHTPSPVQSLPLMKSSHNCQQTVDQYGILSSATCTESHQFRPFSREASGAVTKVTQSLKYRTQSRSPITVQPVTQRVSLMYDHGSQQEISQKAQQKAEEVLLQLCRDTQTDIRPDTPRLFSSLMSALRRVDSSSLQKLYSKLEQNTLCANNIRTRKFFVDALPMVGTDATVTMMTQMLLKNEITGIEADMWLTSLALIQEPTSAMLDQVKAVLTSKTVGEKAMLPVSTMVNNFCQRQPHCSMEPAVQAIMTSFEDVIGSSCYVNKKNLDQVLMALRAIGNAGHLSSSVSVLNKCVKRSRNPMEIRVAAAQAFRRMPCDADRTAVTFIMEDNQEDSELRIASYLALMTCPDDVALQRVQLLLESEQDQQVGSFVWSHLSNLQETSSPHKQAIRELLKNVQLPSSFDLGRLQFSRNYEGSAFLKRLNSGAAAESNLVWSSASSLPRSLSANLTVDLFGRSLNLLDFGLRLEGLEYLLETMLGPYGYFAQSGKDQKNDRQLEELKGSMYMRMFGNEMTFQRFQGLDSFSSATSFNLLDFLIKLSKNHDISMTHSAEFLDTELTVPTSCGLPLSLTVKGTASMDLKASGKVDLRKVSATPRSLQIDGEIRPSGAIRISGQMAVDAQVSRAALLVTGTLHSSTALKARVNLDRGRVLSMELDIPQDKMDIFDISSEFSIVHNTVEKKQKMITENRQTLKVCTGEAAAHITGLELCGELQFPNASTRVSGPYFPFTGPTSLSVALYKKDTHSSYKLLAKRVENKKKTMAQLSFNTPGSKVDRSLAFDLVINHVDRQLEVSAASPWKKAEFKGAITNTKKLMGVSGSFVTDDVNVYSLTTEVKVDQTKNGVRYTPLMEVRHPDMDKMALTGIVAMETRAATVDLSLTGVTKRPLKLKSEMTNTQKEMSLTGSFANGDKEEYSMRAGTKMNIGNNKENVKIQLQPFLSVKTPRREVMSFSGSALYNQDKVLKTDLTFSLLHYKPLTAQLTATKSERKNSVRYTSKGSVRSSVVSGSVSSVVSVKKGRMVSSRTTLSYNVPRVVRDKLELTAKLSDRSTKSYLKYNLRSNLESKSFPDYNTDVKLNMDHKKKLSSAEVEVRYGSDPKDRSRRVLLSGTVARKIKDFRNVYLNYKMAAEALQQNIDVKIEGKHQHSPSNLESNVALSLAKSQDVSVALVLENKSSKLKKLNGELNVKALGTAVSLKSALNQVSKKQWEHSVDVKAGSSKHSINTVYKTRGGDSHQLQTTLDLQDRSPVILSGEVNLDWQDLELTAAFQQDKMTYGISAIQKLAKSRNGKWSAEVMTPSRRMTLKANGGKVKGNYEGSLQAAWDADKDKNAKVEIEGLLGSKSSKDHSSHKARISLSTPLKGYTDLAANVALDSSSSQHTLTTKLVMGERKKVITSTFMVATPLTLRDIDLAFNAETPYRGYGNLGLALVHKMDSGLATKLTLTLQKEQCDITLTAQNRGTDGARDLQAQLDLKSTLRLSSLKSLSVSAEHKDNGGQLTDSILMKINNKVYSSALNMQLDTRSSSADLTVSWPKDQLKATWTHRLSASDLTSTFTSTWSSNQRVQLDVTGSHVPGSLSGSLVFQSPRQRDWRAEMSTQYGADRIQSSSSVKKQDREIFSHNLLLSVDVSKTDLDFSVTSPWTDPISSKVNAKYQSYPMSASVEFSWEPRKKVTAEGSVILNNWDDLDLNMRVTTPVPSWRTLAAQISSKSEGSEIITQLNVDLGMRNNVILTSRVQRDISGVRVKLTTPWDTLRVMDTGVDTNIHSAAGKVKADFKAVPLVGQYEAVASWDAVDDLNARFRLDTPREDFPYLQIMASSKEKRRVRQSRVELEYSPRQTYSLESTYSFDLPLVLDVNVATPLQGYESLSASFRHNMRDTAMDASAQITYSTDKTVKMTSMMDWSRGLDGSITMATPFSGWEQSSATLRHEGDWNDFNSLADVTVGGQGVTGSLKFLHKMKTDVQLTVTTPWAGWEKIEAAVSRKGELTNLRGTATLVYSGQKMEGTVMNKWNSRKARLVASLSSPYTEDLKLNFEQNADLQTEASLSYGRQYTVDTSSSFLSNSRELSASTNIKYRVAGPRHLITASVAKVGSLQDLTLTASTSMDKQEISMTAELNTLRDIKAAVALKTPFDQFESLKASFHNSGDWSGMTTEANIQYMTDRNIHAKVDLGLQDLSQVSFRGTFSSPLRGLEHGTLSLSHKMGSEMLSGSLFLDTSVGDFGPLDGSYQMTGHVNNVKAESRVTFNNQLMLDATMTHKLTSSRLRSSLHLMTSMLPELTMEINHQGSIQRFTSKASASLGHDKVSSETQWSMSGDNVDLSQSLYSNVQGDVNQATITLSKVGPLSDVTMQLSGNVNAKKAKVVGKLTTVHDISATLEVESPFRGYQQMGASFQKTGDFNDLSVTATANLERQRIEMISKFSQDSEVRGSVEITTPFFGYREMGAAFSYGEENAMLSGNLQNDKIEATGRFVNNGITEGNLDITTPFHGYRQMAASFHYDGENARVSGNLQDKKVEATGRFVNGDDVEGSLQMTTPFNGYQQMGASFNYGGENGRISANVEKDKVEATGRFVRSDSTEGNVDITSPFNGYRQMGGSFNYGSEDVMISAYLENDKVVATGRYTPGEGSVDITSPFNGYQQMGGSFNYGNGDAMVSGYLQNDKIVANGRYAPGEGSITIETPFNGYRQMGASFNQDRNSLTATANLQNDKVEAAAHYDNADDITGSLKIATPFTGYTQLGGQFRYSGDRSDVTVASSGHVESSSVEVTGRFHYGQDVSGSIEMTTPFRGFRNMGSSFAMNGDWSDLTLTADASLQRDRVDVKATFQNGNDMSGSVKVNTPFHNYRSMGASFQQTGDFNDLSVVLAANLMQDKLETRVAFTNTDSLSGSVSMATPFEGFRQVGATFKHTGDAANFNSEGQVTYMDGQTISGKVNFLNYRLRRIETSAELTTPFTNWEMTKVSYTHSGRTNKFECNAMLECSRGQKHTANLKVDLRRDQKVQVTVTTPYDGFHLTELTHAFSHSDSSVQWSETLVYGEGQRASSQLTVSYPDNKFTSTFDLQTPFTSDLSASVDFQGVLYAHKGNLMVKYGDRLHFTDSTELQISDSPLMFFKETLTYSIDGATNTQSVSLRREGPWNDVTLTVKGQKNGKEVGMDTSFKNNFGRMEGSVKINTPFDGYRDIGASFQHVGEVSSTFSTEGKVEYTDGQEISGKLDFLQANGQRLEVTAELTTPFEDWTQTRAEYRHQADQDGVTCYAGVEYHQGERLTGDLRVTSSPHPEVTLTVKTPWNNWEQMMATGSAVNDGWGHREVSSKVDLGQGHVYTLQSSLTAKDDAPKSFTARLTSPHTNWHTLEARASHQGGLENFQSSAYLSTPLLESLSASASVRYSSLFDLTATASVDTPFQGFKDWKMEMVNGERGSQKTSHVTLGWSGDQEIIMDGTWRHDNSWYERHVQTEVSLTTPFEVMRRSSWLLEHHATQGHYTNKMTGSLNGNKLMDLDLDTQTGDLPKVTMTLNEPYAMQYSAGRTSEGGELSLDWDRNDPNSNLHMTSRFSDSSDSSNLQHDLDVKVTHPSQTVGAKYSLLSSPQTTSSQGEVYWGRGGDRRMFYTLDLSHLNRRSSSSCEGKVKVGVLSRAVQLSGAVTQSPMSRQMDATVHWDADRDQNKQVTLKTRWTSGDKNKADVTLSLPSINQEVRVQSEVAVNQGKTLLDATTALSYSPDSSKVVTFTSKLQDTTSDWDSGSNYTLHLSLTHPHTDLDLSMTSHLGASEDKYSAAIDTWYLTTGRQRKNMALRGEINQLRRQLTMEMVSPVKKVMMKGEVKSVDPYSLSLTNQIDDDVTTRTDVTVDTNKRSFSFKTNYDLEHPERSLVLKALYVNDTAIMAQMYRDHVTDVITDALLALRLNTSTLLHSRLHWRPSGLSDLQDFALLKLRHYATGSKQSLQTVSDALRDEVSARYSRSAAAVAEELTPWIDLVNTEMQEGLSLLTDLRRQLHRFYRRSALLHSMGSAVTTRFQDMQTYIGEVSESYQRQAEALRQQMQEAVQSMTDFSAGEYYQQSINTLITAAQNMIDTGVDQLTQMVMSLDNYLVNVRQHSVHMANSMSDAVYNVSSHSYVSDLSNSLDFTPYLHSALHHLSAVRMPEKYTAALYKASSDVSSSLSDLLNTEMMSEVRETSNQVYQQGVWAYHYWEVEENLEKHLHSIATLLKEIIEEELEMYARHFRFLQDSHVTVWDPEHGEAQADIRLPVAMETLDSVPDVTPLVMQYEAVMKAVPDMDTVQYFYNQYVPQSAWWPRNSSSQQEQQVQNRRASRGDRAERAKYYKRRNRVAAL